MNHLPPQNDRQHLGRLPVSHKYSVIPKIETEDTPNQQNKKSKTKKTKKQKKPNRKKEVPRKRGTPIVKQRGEQVLTVERMLKAIENG